MSDLMKAVEAPVNPNVPDLRPGDVVKVFLRIKEGNNERTQEVRRNDHPRPRQPWEFGEFYRPPCRQQWHRGGAHLPDPLTSHRKSRDRAPFQGAPGTALLPARAHRQERPSEAEV